MNPRISELHEIQPTNSFLVCIDSDGCVFDSMEIKHKKCFCPNTVRYWGLQLVSKYVREVTEFINLYSQWRGINRWPALVMTMDMLRERPEVQARQVIIPELPKLREFLTSDKPLSNDGLQAFRSVHPSEELRLSLEWSDAVNRSIRETTASLPPFPLVYQSIEKLHRTTDLIVVSQATEEALSRDWGEHNLARYVQAIAGQESGTKIEQIRLASEGRYEKKHVLMVGDAPGDLNAARANGTLFYPINPGAEQESWERFYSEGIDRFLAGQFAGAYEQELVDEFSSRVPEFAPWQNA